MTDHWIQRFQYNYWANKKLLDAQTKEEIDDQEIIDQLNHLFAVELMWFERMVEGTSNRNPHNPQHTKGCEALMHESQERYATMLHELEKGELWKTRTYYNTKGDEYQDTLADLLDHVLNHSEHHRSQIVYRMRKLGYEPPATDYIFYLR